MSDFDTRPTGTVMYGAFNAFAAAERALRVLKNAGYARAALEATGAEERSSIEPAVVVVDAAAAGATRAAEILEEYGARIRFAPEAVTPEHPATGIVAPEPEVLENVALDNTAAENVAAELAVTEHVAAELAIPEHVAAELAVPERVASELAASEHPASENVEPENVLIVVTETQLVVAKAERKPRVRKRRNAAQRAAAAAPNVPNDWQNVVIVTRTIESVASDAR